MSAQDEDLCSLKHIVKAEWPNQIKEVLLEIQPYWDFYDKITMDDGPVLKGTRFIIPRGRLCSNISMQTTLIYHNAYTEQNKLYSQPGLYDQIHELVANCQTGMKFSKNDCKKGPSQQLGQDVPLVPCSKFATYIFHFENSSCLHVSISPSYIVISV